MDFGTLGSSLRSPAEVEGNEGFPPQPEKDLESPSSKKEGIPKGYVLHDSIYRVTEMGNRLVTAGVKGSRSRRAVGVAD